MALLHLLCLIQEDLSLQIAVAHFDHQLRGEESRRDAEFVKKLAKKDLGLPFHMGTEDIKGIARARGLSTQETARTARYAFFRHVLDETGSSHLLTAHTADDQAEELLLRLIRGTGLAGLSGIPWTRDGWIARPLLDFTKRELLDFLANREIPFVVDSSNLSEKYLRNKVRHRLIPMLSQEFNPAIVQTLAGSAEIVSEEHLFLERLAEKALADVLLGENDPPVPFALDAERLAGLDRALRRRVIRLAFTRLGLHMGRTGSRHILAVDSLLERGAANWETRLPGGWTALRQGERVCFIQEQSRVQKQRDGASGQMVLVEGPGTWPSPSGLGQVEISPVEEVKLKDVREQTDFPKPIFLEPGKVSFPLSLRCRRPGERFWPLGGRCPYKLKDFLISRKVPRELRDILPLLASDNEVLAVLGVEVAHPYRLCQSGTRALRVVWKMETLRDLYK